MPFQGPFKWTANLAQFDLFGFFIWKFKPQNISGISQNISGYWILLQRNCWAPDEIDLAYVTLNAERLHEKSNRGIQENIMISAIASGEMRKVWCGILEKIHHVGPTGDSEKSRWILQFLEEYCNSQNWLLRNKLTHCVWDPRPSYRTSDLPDRSYTLNYQTTAQKPAIKISVNYAWLVRSNRKHAGTCSRKFTG